jgi:hypothetical protein
VKYKGGNSDGTTFGQGPDLCISGTKRTQLNLFVILPRIIRIYFGEDDPNTECNVICVCDGPKYKSELMR